jgi:hypothetical protein
MMMVPFLRDLPHDGPGAHTLPVRAIASQNEGKSLVVPIVTGTTGRGFDEREGDRDEPWGRHSRTTKNARCKIHPARLEGAPRRLGL